MNSHSAHGEYKHTTECLLNVRHSNDVLYDVTIWTYRFPYGHLFIV